MNPPDVYDAEGRPYEGPERRHEVRRNADAAAELTDGWSRWFALMFANRAKVVALASVLTFIATTLGWRLVGPRQDLSTIANDGIKRDSAIRIRVNTLENNQEQMKSAMAEMRTSLRFQNYLLCVQLRRNDPASTPPECGAIEQNRGTP